VRDERPQRPRQHSGRRPTNDNHTPRLRLAVLVLLASITNSFVQIATNVVSDLGLVGIFLLMLAESACIPIPSEATMLFAGFGVSQGHYSLLAITVAGVLGNLIGSWLAYGVGYFGRMELVDRHARKLHIKSQHLEWADRWFARYGEATVFFARMLPIIRTFISLPAGVARMPFWRFTVFTLLGCVPWVFMLGFIGDQVGHNWTQWKDNLRYVDYVVVLAVLGGIAYATLRWFRRRRASHEQVLSSGSENERQVRKAQENGAHPEHETNLNQAVGQPQVSALPPIARVDREDHGDAAKVPRESKEQWNQPRGDAEHPEDASNPRAASVHEEHPPFDDEQSSTLGGRSEPLP
jgi:membrane protein DedA with SNARE-associated domain